MINVAVIRGAFGRSFQIIGMDVPEAQDLALLIRAGLLAAPVYPIEVYTFVPDMSSDIIIGALNDAVPLVALLAIFFLIMALRRE